MCIYFVNYCELLLSDEKFQIINNLLIYIELYNDFNKGACP